MTNNHELTIGELNAVVGGDFKVTAGAEGKVGTSGTSNPGIAGADKSNAAFVILVLLTLF